MIFFERLALIEPTVQVEQNVSLARHTTLRVGGPADYFAQITEENQLTALLDAAGAAGMPVLLMGNGSNLLVRDGGFRGLVIHLGRGFSRIERTAQGLYAQAGANLSALAGRAREEALQLQQLFAEAHGQNGHGGHHTPEGRICIRKPHPAASGRGVLHAVRFGSIASYTVLTMLSALPDALSPFQEPWRSLMPLRYFIGTACLPQSFRFML